MYDIYVIIYVLCFIPCVPDGSSGINGKSSTGSSVPAKWKFPHCFANCESVVKVQNKMINDTNFYILFYHLPRSHDYIDM